MKIAVMGSQISPELIRSIARRPIWMHALIAVVDQTEEFGRSPGYYRLITQFLRQRAFLDMRQRVSVTEFTDLIVKLGPTSLVTSEISL